MNGLRLAAVAALIACSSAHAAFTVTFAEVGGNVVATGTGSINTAALNIDPIVSVSVPQVQSFLASVLVGGIAGGNTPVQISAVASVTGPTSFSPLPNVSRTANAAIGPIVGIAGISGRVYVPAGYVSTAPINSSATFNGATFASLRLTPGTYTWTWGVGPTADTFTVVIPAPAPAVAAQASIPTLSQWSLIGLASVLAMLGFARTRRR